MINSIEIDNFLKFCIKNNNYFATRTQHSDQNNIELKRNAGVLITIFKDKDNNKLPLSIILTIRSSKLKQHSGEISFPGGKCEKKDKSIVNTAIREAIEEINIVPNDLKIYGTLNSEITITGFNITPVLSYYHGINNFKTNEEVSKIIFIPLDIILDDRLYKINSIKINELEYKIVELHYQNYNIWGITALFLFRLALTYQKFIKK